MTVSVTSMFRSLFTIFSFRFLRSATLNLLQQCVTYTTVLCSIYCGYLRVQSFFNPISSEAFDDRYYALQLLITPTLLLAAIPNISKLDSNWSHHITYNRLFHKWMKVCSLWSTLHVHVELYRNQSLYIQVVHSSVKVLPWYVIQCFLC